MGIDHYEYLKNESLQRFDFESVGPNGTIKKSIRYILRNTGGRTYFNLAFGDINEETGELNDLAITDNKDTEKVLATIASSLLELTEKYPDLIVYAEGSTPARTRLYQMGIAAHWHEIEPLLNVYGSVISEWIPFEKNINFDAFFAFRKNW